MSNSGASFKGTKFENLESKIKNDINKKRRRDEEHDDNTDDKKGKSAHKQPKLSKIKSLDVSAIKQIKAFNRTKPDTVMAKPTKAVVKTNKSKSTTREPEPENSYNNNRTVYIQGLPFTCKETEVTDFFKGCGETVSVRLPKWHDSGNLKGYGHIEFKTTAGADAALELSGQYLKDRYVMVERPMTPRVLQAAASSSAGADGSSSSVVEKVRPTGCRTVFVKNLPYEVTEAELLEAFRIYGPVASIRLAEWGHTKNLKGFGYIEFQRENSAEVAVKKSGTLVLKDRPVVVDYETGKPKGSYKKETVKVAGGKVTTAKILTKKQAK